MSEGIPIPARRYYCANCGEHHFPAPCPTPQERTATDKVAAEVAALRISLRETDDHVQELTERLSALEAARKDKKR